MNVRSDSEMFDALSGVNIPDGFIVCLPRGILGGDIVGFDVRCDEMTLNVVLHNLLGNDNVPMVGSVYKGDEIKIIAKNLDGDRIINWNPNDAHWEMVSDEWVDNTPCEMELDVQSPSDYDMWHDIADCGILIEMIGESTWIFRGTKTNLEKFVGVYAMEKYRMDFDEFKITKIN